LETKKSDEEPDSLRRWKLKLLFPGGFADLEKIS
jgi:hypothetical protein